jgi:hypothetical protein
MLIFACGCSSRRGCLRHRHRCWLLRLLLFVLFGLLRLLDICVSSFFAATATAATTAATATATATAAAAATIAALGTWKRTTHEGSFFSAWLTTTDTDGGCLLSHLLLLLFFLLLGLGLEFCRQLGRLG